MKFDVNYEMPEEYKPFFPDIDFIRATCVFSSNEAELESVGNFVLYTGRSFMLDGSPWSKDLAVKDHNHLVSLVEIFDSIDFEQEALRQLQERAMVNDDYAYDFEKENGDLRHG